MTDSYTMFYVNKRAEAEQRHGGREKRCVEDLFLAVLKLCEIRAHDFMMLTAATREEVDKEIDVLAAQFRDEYKVDTTRLRGQLRRELAQGAAVQPELLPDYLKRGEEIAQARGAKDFFPRDLLAAIVEKPTEALMQVCDIANWGKKKEEPPKTEQEHTEESPQGGEEMSLDFLPRLTARVRRMRGQLLNTVQGQDHVVHAFAEGIFAAEVLAAGDEKRQRPRAIFAFIGPPGVGKTFLAEQGAEAMNLPYKRFDMSTYADQQAYMGLVGFEKSYHDAKEGMLTGFVKENPHSILLFDEIEKAHLNTIQLFLQILDAGRLADRYHGEDVSFRDTILIFTSNAGRSLYEGEGKQSAAGIPRKTLMGALETETDSRTGRPFFPPAITSRLATGWPLLFNHLAPHDLQKISGRELTRFGELFLKQYGVSVCFDELLPTALLFREGGAVDARTLRAQTELFFKNEIFKLCRLWGEDSFPKAVSLLETLEFKVETDTLSGEVRSLFFDVEKPEVLLYSNDVFAWRCREVLSDYVFHTARTVEEALAIAGEKDIRLVLLDIAEPAGDEADPMATAFEGMDREALMRTAGAFDYTPMAASAFRDGTALFRTLQERLPELPVYLLETGGMSLDDELTMSFIRAGARGKLSEPQGGWDVFEDQLAQICRELYLQSAAAGLASERKVLSFDTAPRLSEDGKRITVRLREFSLKRAATAEDAGSVLDDVEKPNVRFSDVIGASDAKDELAFFIDYLKNPKQFSARGLKPPKGVLLYGPPGTGKTMLAKAMAGESDVAFLPTAASSFVTKWQGSGPQSVRDLFQRARRYAPAIIFIDEIDAIGRKRAAGSTAHGEEMALNALLTEMDGFSVDPKRPVFVLAATNFDVEEGKGGMGVIDPALARRFDRKILVDLPNEEERTQLLRLLLSQNASSTVTDEMIVRTARRAVGMSPANITTVTDLANRMAVKAGKPLDDAILDEAFELTRHGEKKDWGYEYLERVARHESGHAMLCCMAGKTPAYLTIVARGSHGGYMEHGAGEMGPLSTKQELLGRIRTSLAGRAAELVYYGPEAGISTGASGDLEQATRTAAAMLCAYGMDENFGLAAMDPGKALGEPAFRARINQILRAELETTVALIQENRPRIDRLVDALLAKNKLTGTEIEEILQD